MIDPGGLFEKAKDMVEEKLNIDVDPMLEKAQDIFENIKEKMTGQDDSKEAEEATEEESTEEPAEEEEAGSEEEPEEEPS